MQGKIGREEFDRRAKVGKALKIVSAHTGCPRSVLAKEAGVSLVDWDSYTSRGTIDPDKRNKMLARLDCETEEELLAKAANLPVQTRARSIPLAAKPVITKRIQSLAIRAYPPGEDMPEQVEAVFYEKAYSRDRLREALLILGVKDPDQWIESVLDEAQKIPRRISRKNTSDSDMGMGH